MKNVKMQKFKPFIGIIIMLLTFAMVLGWENFGREELLYTNIIELKKDVEPGTIVTKEMLTVGRIEKGKISEQSIIKNEDVIGKIAKAVIPKGMQLDKRFFDTKDLSVKKDEYVFRIPSSWIVAIPSSIRRGDVASFYEVDAQSVSKISSNLNSASQPQNTSQIQQIGNQSITQIKQQLNNILLSCTIVYVKDSSNREVITTSKDERFDGSSQVAEVEIIATLEKIQKLKDSADSGNRFIILY
jgi:hypothetical protein